MLRKYNYVLLLVGLLFMLLGSSIGIQHPELSTPIIVDISIAVVFVVSVWSLLRSRSAFITGCVLAGIAFVLSVSARTTDSLLLQYLALGSVLIFFLMTCTIIAYDVLLGGPIDLNRLVGAGCIYLLSGTTWGFAYLLLSVAVPTSFTGMVMETWREQLNEFIYHSFVTLTTLGYGDLTPVEPVARTLCYLEAVLGQLYLTVLVASLVGMHLATRRA